MKNLFKNELFKIIAGLTFFIPGAILAHLGYTLISLALLVTALLISGFPVFFGAVKGILRRDFLDEKFLMSIASLGAFVIGEATEGVAVMLFFLIGEFFEHKAVRKSRSSIKELLDICLDTARVVIDGVESLGGTEHTMLPDMIEVGSFIGMAAMNRSELTIKDVSYENLGIIPAQFARMGIKFEQRGDDIYIPQQDHYSIESFIDGSIMTIADAPWPGLTPDLLSIFLVVATQAKGSVLIHQKMFESRLFFVDKLIDMGAQIILCDPHRATVIGHDHRMPLRAANMTSPDIRAGVALLIAAMSAEGTSTIQNIEQIDRGYRDIETRLNALGARITRIDE